jgi:hypothetical protein
VEAYCGWLALVERAGFGGRQRVKIIIHETPEPLLAMRAAQAALSKGKPDDNPPIRFITFEFPSGRDEEFAIKWNKESVSVWHQSK